MFITIEGVEGSGKSTLIKGLEEKFLQEKKEVLITREPGGSSLGLKLRHLLLSTNAEKISTRAEMLLFLADRAEHVDKIILPALQSDKIVLCDRYIHSTLAYQGYARGNELELLQTFVDYSCASLTPDIVFLLDLDVEIGLKRAKSRNFAQDIDEGKFEAEELSFHQKVREGFLDLAKNSPYIYTIDATITPEDIIQKAWAIIKEH